MTKKNETPVTFIEGLKQLKEELAAGTRPVPDSPTALPLGSIKTAELILQPRTFGGGEQAASTDHVEKLVAAIRAEKSKHLDPLVVWWSGKCWRVLDGHHRLAAYRTVHKEGKIKLGLIPVTAFVGTLEEAILESARLNSKDKLPMSPNDKFNRAWRMVVMSVYSKEKICSSCKVANGTVGTMRKMLEELKEWSPDHWETYAHSHTWEEIRTRGEDNDDKGSEEWVERTAQEWAKRLGKEFGSKFAERGQIAARALEIYSPKLVEDLMEQWQYADSDDDEELPF